MDVMFSTLAFLSVIARTSPVMSSKLPADGSLPCPVRIEQNHSSYCICTTFSEIRCYGGLAEIPRFSGSLPWIYEGIYMAGQKINRIHDWSFNNIKVRIIYVSSNSCPQPLALDRFTTTIYSSVNCQQFSGIMPAFGFSK